MARLPLPDAAPSDIAALCRAILETTQAGVCVTDAELRFVLVNPAACRTYGRPRSALVGQPFTIVVDPAQREKAAAAHHAFLRGEGGMSGEWIIRRPDGTQATVLASVSRLIMANGQRLRVSTIMDVTDARRTERALAEAAQAKARFLGAMNQEFRTPISAILGHGDLLLAAAQHGDVPARHEALIRDIRAAAEHVMGLLQDTLDHARLADGLYVPVRRWTGLSGLAEAAARLSRFALEDARVPLRLEGGPDAPLHVDPPAMRQALMNMIRVAARRAGPGCELALRWRLDGASVAVELGCAAPPAVVSLHQRRAAQDAALPEFGLEIAGGIARAHDGELEVTGVEEGRFALVLRLPLPAAIPA